MPRDIPVGNGNLLVAFDKNGILREFFFPHVGEENHTQGEPFRFGVFSGGQFSWIPDGWEVSRNYLDDSLVTEVVFTNESLGLRIVSHDLVDFNENLYLKKITLENLTDEGKEGRLFLGQDFHIYGTTIGDTAAYKPEVNGLLHYKGERYFLANIYANKKFGIDLYSTGNKESEKYQGTWKDAEDGQLEGNPIAQGAVDSILGIPFNLEGKGTDTYFYWIAAGKKWEEVAALDQMVRLKTPDGIFKRTFDYWKLWVDKEKINYTLLPEKIARLYKRSLLICRTQINNSGSIIASNDSDAIDFNRDTYSYMWPRDASFVAYALDLAGYDFTRNFFNFCSRLITKEGYFLHKYTPSGSLASSWHPWVDPTGKKMQLPIQEDETALVIWALGNHYKSFRDIEFLMPLYQSLVKKGADFMMEYRDMKTGLPLPSYDLWEERYGIFTYTASTVYGGLMAASQLADAFGETNDAEEYRQGAVYMREGMDKHLYLEKEKRFARSVEFHKDGSKKIDSTIDSSLFAVFAFGAYTPDDPKVKSTMDQIVKKLWHPNGGGLARYENDTYYRDKGQEGPGNPWFITTLWLAQYRIALSKTENDLKEALAILEWVADHALSSGVLAEQVNPATNEPISVSPLTWSHANFIAAVQEYLNQLLQIDKCPSCNLPKYSKTRKN